MRVLVGCESSGIVRDSFIALGHDAVSCDLLPTERPGPHMQGDVLTLLNGGDFDLAIFHPPCTYLCSSGLHWNRQRPERVAQTEAAAAFFMALASAPIPRIAIENPIGCMSTRYRKPDQIIHPWEYGHDASKATCLWLTGLPLLVPTDVLPGGRTKRRGNQTASGQNKLGPSPDRWKLRSQTYPGIAACMALTWGNLAP